MTIPAKPARAPSEEARRAADDFIQHVVGRDKVINPEALAIAFDAFAAHRLSTALEERDVAYAALKDCAADIDALSTALLNLSEEVVREGVKAYFASAGAPISEAIRSVLRAAAMKITGHE